LHTTLYTIGAVVGLLTAIGLTTASGGNFQLVFWLAAIPGFISVAVLVIGVKELPKNWPVDPEPPIAMRPRGLWRLSPVSGGRSRSQRFFHWPAAVRHSCC
jgi:hypothetical protein